MKNPLTPAGIEPATFRFVAQHLNHCATAVEGTGHLKISKDPTQNRIQNLPPYGEVNQLTVPLLAP